MQPTADDLARDLAADMPYALHPPNYYNLRAYHEAVTPGWPAAIRRAIAAEAEVLRLRTRVAELEATGASRRLV